MATDTKQTPPRQMAVMADFKGKVDPDWCPGCGDFGVLAAVQKALVDLQIPNHECGHDQRHRLLVQLPRLYQHLRHAHACMAARLPWPPESSLPTTNSPCW